jgi:hypothetical protein
VLDEIACANQRPQKVPVKEKRGRKKKKNIL